ncbi:MAG: hypothetical protein AB1426_04430 [Bacillota bacterium]
MRLLLVALVCVLVTAVAGCGKKAPEQPQTTMPGLAGPIQPTAIDFERVEEVTLTSDLARTLDKDLRTVFTKVFGGAKLSRFFEMGGQMGQGTGGSHFTYTLKRQTKADDVAALKKELGTKGYNFTAEAPRDGITTLSFTKNVGEKTYAVTVGMTLTDQRISVVVFPSGGR